MVLITADAKALGSPSKLAPLVAVPRLRLQSALLRKSKMRGEIALIAVRPRRRRIVPFHRGIRGRAEAWAKRVRDIGPVVRGSGIAVCRCQGESE